MPRGVKRRLAASGIGVKIFFAPNEKKVYLPDMRFRIFFILLCFVAMGAIFPRAESVRADQTPLPDVAVEYAGMEGGAVAAALLVTLPPGYHAYAHDDTGALPTRLRSEERRVGKECAA